MAVPHTPTKWTELTSLHNIFRFPTRCIPEMPPQINVADFDLAATLESGQAFRWRREADGWYVGVIGRQVFRLRQNGATLAWQAVGQSLSAPATAAVIAHYLALDRSLTAIVATFP